MSWPYLPEDFRAKYRSVWVDIPNRLFDPEKGNALYHQYLSQLEYAEELGFDAIGVNEHHANAYGLMPSPNLMASILARTTHRAAILVLGNSVALYNPPLRVAEELAMLDVMSGGRLIAGFPRRHLDGYQLRLRTDSRPHAQEISGSSRAHPEGVARRGALRVRRRVQPAALGQLLAATPPATPPAGLDSRWWIGRDLGISASSTITTTRSFRSSVTRAQSW